MANPIDTLKTEMTTQQIAAEIRQMARGVGQNLDCMTDDELVARTRQLIESGEAARARSQ